MGGQGSGRKPDVVKRMIQQQTPIVPTGDPIFLPNLSGVKEEARKTSAVDIVGVGTETDPIFMALSGGYIPTSDYPDFELSGAVTVSGAITTHINLAGAAHTGITLQNYSTALSGAHAVTSGAATTHIGLTDEHINWKAASDNLATTGTISGAAYTSGAVPLYYTDTQVDHDATTNFVAAEHLTGSTFELSGAVTVSGAITTHLADTSDPHGATLTQTNLSLTSGSTSADADASGAALFKNILIGTEASPGAASNWTQGTVYLQYTA